jgi:hypothetical protein
MSSFNFGGLTNTTGVASDKRLRPFSINKVKFVESKVDVLHSEKNGTDYDIFKVRFEGEHGYYEENLFLPDVKGQDVERTPNNWGGENPSNADRAMMFFAHCLAIINKEGFEKLKKVVGNAKSFKDVATMAQKLLNEKKGKDVYLKLVGRVKDGVTYAALPYYTSINKESGDAYVSNNFLALEEKGLGFTPSEEKKRQEFESATPTAMPADKALDQTTDNSDIDAAATDDLQDMLAGL